MSAGKDLGIVYTPKELTKFLCTHTIIPYILEKINQKFQTDYFFNGNKDFENIFDEMPLEYLIFTYDLVKDIKILDPAVGIGYFLLESIHILIRLYNIFIKNYIVKLDEFSVIEWLITQNIYGVDISQEAVEKSKKNLEDILRKQEKKNNRFLEKIDHNIKSGNALIGKVSDTDEFYSKHFLEEVSLFHWSEEFPKIMKNGGFDIILGNPPWNILKPQEKEFFSRYDPSLTKYNFDKREATLIIEKLLENEEIRIEWNNYRDSIQNQALFFRKTYRYQSDQLVINGKTKKVGGDLNLYKLFIERIYQILKPFGYCGLVVPSGVHTDAGTKGLRRLLFESNRVSQLYCFENRKGIFPSIHKSFKFDLLIFRKGGKTKVFPAVFMRREQKILQIIDALAVKINWDLIKRLSPTSWSILEFKTNNDIKIARKMYQYPILSKSSSNENWRLKLMRELDITLDSDLFNTNEQGYIIYEGKMIEQYTHLFKEPRYWIDYKKLISKFGEEYKDFKEYRLGFRAIAASTNQRTMVATILPPNVCISNSIIASRIFHQNNKKRLIKRDDLLFLCGIFNSFIFDYLLRLKVTTNINMFYIYDMPVPRLEKGNKEYEEIVRLVTKILSKYLGFEKLRGKSDLMNFNNQNLNIHQIRAEIDLLVAKIYNINQDELEYILDQFHQRDSKKEELLNELKNEIMTQFRTNATKEDFT